MVNNRPLPVVRMRVGTASRRHELSLAATVGLGVAAAGAIVARLGADEHWPIDHAIRNVLRARKHPRTSAALRITGAAGTLGVYGPAVMITTLLVARRRDAEHAWPLAASIAGAAVLTWAVKHMVKRPRPVGAGVVNKHPSFPSGHATRATAAASVIAYVLVRERMARRSLATPIAAALATAVGVSRAYADAHWTTDVIGGWALGAATAAGGALWYERIHGARA